MKLNKDNIDEAIHDYKIQLALLQSGYGGNPIVGMMENGYTEEEAKYVADLYLSEVLK